MPVETPSLFAQVIQDHLELKRKNSTLEPEMPISGYMAEDPFENHPLFKTEEQARVEDTMSGQESILQESTSLEWPGAEETFVSEPEPDAEAATEPFGELFDGELPVDALPEVEPPAEEAPLPEPDTQSEEGLWTRSRDFDWGD